MNSLPRIASPVLLVAALLIPTAVAAQSDAGDEPAELEDEQRAADYYDEASRAYADGRFERAAELLEQAYSLEPHLVYRYNQILALQGAGDYEAALALLEDHEEELREDGEFSDIEEIRGELEAALADRDESRPAADEVEPPETATGDESGADTGGSGLPGWALVGTGTASAGTGLVLMTGLLIGDTIDRLESAPDEGVQQVYGDTTHSRDDDLSRLRTHQWLGAGLVAGGLALGAAGGALLWSSPESNSDTANPRALRLRPMVDIDAAGAMLEGGF